MTICGKRDRWTAITGATMLGNDQSWQAPYLEITDLWKKHALIRQALRKMLKGRTRMFWGRPHLPCGCCGQDVKDGFDMHEALIGRSRANPAAQYMIFTPQNVIQICRDCHEKHQGTKYLLDRALPYLIEVEGAESVAAWWMDVSVKLKLAAPVELPEDTNWKKYLLDTFNVKGES